MAIPAGVAIKVIGSHLKLEAAVREKRPYVHVSADVENAHNEYDRCAAQQRLVELEEENPGVPAYRDLARAHHSDCSQPSDVYVRDAGAGRGLKWLCEGRAGGPQGSALTSVAFPVLLDVILKAVERKYPGVEVKAIQDDVDLYGDPADILGDDGALEFLLAELKRIAKLKPNRKKFQAYTPTPEAYNAALAPGQQWLKRPFVITDPETRDRVKAADDLARGMAAAARVAPPELRAAAEAEARSLATAASEMREGTPEGHRAYGIIGCGAAVGDDAFIADFLLRKQLELCGNTETGEPGTIKSVTENLAVRSAQCAHVAIFYSLQSRVDYLVAVHLPEHTQQLAAATDEALRKAYARTFGADMLNPEGDFEGQRDPKFTADRLAQKCKQGGMGHRPMGDRAPFFTAISSALPQMSGSPTEEPLWASLSAVIGDRAVYDKANKPETACWATFLASGSRLAVAFQGEIDRLRGMRQAAIESAGLTATPPKSTIFDAPDAGFGFGVAKVHKTIFDELKSLRVKSLDERAARLLPEDQRRIAHEKASTDPYSNSLLGGVPLKSVQFSNEEFQAAAQSRHGAPLSCLTAFTGHTLKSNASAADKRVDPFGNNIKKLVGATGGGTLANHNATVDCMSMWLERGKIPHLGGCRGKPTTCKGLFTHVTQELNGGEIGEEDYKVLQKVIPDMLIDARSVSPKVENASKSHLAGEQIILEHKTKALNADFYKEGSPVEDKMHDVKGQYEKRLKEVDDLLGTPEGTEGPMMQEAKKYNNRNILVTVGGPFAEMSSDMELLVDLIATALAEEHVSFHADSAKQAKGMFKQRIRKSLGHVAHRGWARLLLDRRRDLIIHGPASHRTDSTAGEEVDERELEHDNYHNPDRGGYNMDA